MMGLICFSPTLRSVEEAAQPSIGDTHATAIERCLAEVETGKKRKKKKRKSSSQAPFRAAPTIPSAPAPWWSGAEGQCPGTAEVPGPGVEESGQE